MITIDKNFLKLILFQLSTAPSPSQVSPLVKKLIRDFRGPWYWKKKHTAKDTFDFINQFGRDGKYFKSGDVSKFVAELCSLDKYYTS